MKKITLSIVALIFSAAGFQSANAQVTQQKPVQSTQVNQQNLIAEENARVEAAKQAEATKVQVEQAEKAAYINQLQQNKPAVVAPATSEKRKSSVAVKENQK
jgi:hypothetical protein